VLKFFGPQFRDQAIEYALFQANNPPNDGIKVVKRLDALSSEANHIEGAW
jgi:hypothetical protein